MNFWRFCHQCIARIRQFHMNDPSVAGSSDPVDQSLQFETIEYPYDSRGMKIHVKRKIGYPDRG